MKKQIGVLVAKFVFAFLFFNYLIFLISRQILVLILQEAIGLNRDLLQNRELVEEQFGTGPHDSFLSYLFGGGLFGNWGISFQTGAPVSAIVGNALFLTLVWLFLSSVVTLGASYLLVKHVFWDDKEKLDIFEGNWLLYALIFAFPLLLFFVFSPGFWIYDGFTHPSVFGSPAFWSAVLLTSVFGVGKMVSEVTMIPTQPVRASDQLDFPNTDNKEVRNKPVSNHEDWDPLTVTLFAFKNSSVFLLELLFFLELVLNIPGAIRQLIQAVLFLDIPLIAALLFYLVLFVLLVRLAIDLTLVVLGYDEAEMLKDHVYPVEEEPPTRLRFAKYLTLGFVGFAAFATLIWLFTGFSLPGISFLHQPSTTNVNNRNLPPFSRGYLLGTDYLGRDVFSQLVFGTSLFLIPIIISVVVRPLVIILVERLPEVRGIDLSYEFSDIMQALPKIPFILVLGLLASISDSILARPMLMVMFSLLFWGWSSKYYLSTSQAAYNGNAFISKYQKLVPISVASVISENFLLSYFPIGGFNTLLEIPHWGDILNNMIQNYPTKYFGVLFFTYLFVVSVLMITTVYATTSLRRK